MVPGGWDMLLEDCEQFENAREFLPDSGSGYSEKPFVVAFKRPGDVEDEPHAINLSAGARPVDCCLHSTPTRTEGMDSPAWPTSGISLGFSLGGIPELAWPRTKVVK
jgi:hypothetical protein